MNRPRVVSCKEWLAQRAGMRTFIRLRDQLDAERRKLARGGAAASAFADLSE